MPSPEGSTLQLFVPACGGVCVSLHVAVCVCLGTSLDRDDRQYTLPPQVRETQCAVTELRSAKAELEKLNLKFRKSDVGVGNGGLFARCARACMCHRARVCMCMLNVCID